MNFSHIKSGCLWTLCLCIEPCVRWVMKDPIKRRFSFPYSLWVSWTWALLDFKAKCFGVLSLRCKCYKLGAHCGVQLFPPQGAAPGFEFSLICGWPCWDGVYDEVLSQLLLPASMRALSPWLSVCVCMLSGVRLFATPWTAARQASLSITNSRSLPKLLSIESVMPSNHLILCCPLLLLPSIFPSITAFTNKSALCIRWPKYWSFSFNISPSNYHSGRPPLGWTGWISLQSKGLSRVFSNTTVQKHQFFCTQLSL